MAATTPRGSNGSADLVEGLVGRAYEQHGAEIRAHLLALLRDPTDAEDLAQEAFLRLHAEVEAGRPPANVRAWLHRVAMNLAMSHGRHRTVARRAEPRLRVDGAAAPTEDVAVRRDEHRRIRAALAELRPSDREVVLLAAAGVEGTELAVRMGRSATATRTLLCRARARLRALVADAEGASAAAT